MLTIKEAAQRLGLKEVTIRLWLTQGRIGYVKLGRAVRIPEGEISRLITSNSVPARNQHGATTTTSHATA